MAELRFYESHLSREAVAFVVGLSKRRQRVVLDLADRIARQPSKIGDYQYIDTAGRADRESAPRRVCIFVLG